MLIWTIARALLALGLCMPALGAGRIHPGLGEGAAPPSAHLAEATCTRFRQINGAVPLLRTAQQAVI
ncbi:hypothetical protein EZH22_25225 [Xanthobacter dioxanivorans]|uniref:Uncharacterized protein n=1 Tax=Xanthobacter dioxanivorans TaxID=2528964 RepID=A0A974SI17_9HYPH|nr:hypothetical protein [Xanthobacter dioxanivorans]QRG06235.1 hypothetical protein EZH22_25225 [Xanthobacter dioxanivorans]